MVQIAFDDPSVRPKIILHIDDDEDDRYFVRRAINDIDSSIILKEAQNGKKALEFLHQARLFGDLPCLIILDINMPVMDGYDTYSEINKNDVLSSIPVVIFTTSRSNNEFNYWRDNKIEIVSKPALFEDFTNSIKKILGYFSAIKK